MILNSRKKYICYSNIFQERKREKKNKYFILTLVTVRYERCYSMHVVAQRISLGNARYIHSHTFAV